MNSHVFPDSKSVGKVLFQMRNSLDVLNQSLIEFDLILLLFVDVGFVFIGEFIVSFEEHIVALFGLFFLSSTEIRIVDGTTVHSFDVYLGGGWNDISLVESSEGNSVNFIRSGYQKQSWIQLLQEHHSSSFESSGQYYKNCARCNRFSQFGGSGFFTVSYMNCFHIISWIIRCFAHCDL